MNPALVPHKLFTKRSVFSFEGIASDTDIFLGIDKKPENEIIATIQRGFHRADGAAPVKEPEVLITLEGTGKYAEQSVNGFKMPENIKNLPVPTTLLFHPNYTPLFRKRKGYKFNGKADFSIREAPIVSVEKVGDKYYLATEDGYGLLFDDEVREKMVYQTPYEGDQPAADPYATDQYGGGYGDPMGGYGGGGGGYGGGGYYDPYLYVPPYVAPPDINVTVNPPTGGGLTLADPIVGQVNPNILTGGGSGSGSGSGGNNTGSGGSPGGSGGSGTSSGGSGGTNQGGGGMTVVGTLGGLGGGGGLSTPPVISRPLSRPSGTMTGQVNPIALGGGGSPSTPQGGGGGGLGRPATPPPIGRRFDGTLDLADDDMYFDKYSSADMTGETDSIFFYAGGRRKKCKDMGLKGKAFRECTKDLRKGKWKKGSEVPLSVAKKVEEKGGKPAAQTAPTQFSAMTKAAKEKALQAFKAAHQEAKAVAAQADEVVDTTAGKLAKLSTPVKASLAIGIPLLIAGAFLLIKKYKDAQATAK